MRGTGKGMILLEDPDGIRMKYVEHPEYVFAGPTEVERVFANWFDVLVFLKLWYVLDRVQWWLDTEATVG